MINLDKATIADEKQVTTPAAEAEAPPDCWFLAINWVFSNKFLP